ncbi:MAG: carbon-nitrogen hydrolase family protein [Candidatus Binatia bacterium]
MKVAAIQLGSRIGDVAANLDACWHLGEAAAAAGARWIILPEFFTTGMGFVPALAELALAPDGAATELLLTLARRHDAFVGGSFLCRDADGHARNAFLLAGPGGLVGRHDKDLPTMWENCFYVGGTDDGRIAAGRLDVGAAVCWELMRTATARRLRARVDLVVGGSCWWSWPDWPPRVLSRRIEAANARTAARVAPALARLVGAPVVHAAHCGPVACDVPWSPVRYRGHYQGGALVCDAQGTVRARRDAADGPGIAVADIEPGRATPADGLPGGFWLHRRGPMLALMWAYQRLHGRRWYARHTAGRPALSLAWRAPEGARETAGSRGALS